tara:strand:- start:968 stop:1768 length:801 start_codon:yes stop_codon:yes gene_type:complete
LPATLKLTVLENTGIMLKIFTSPGGLPMSLLLHAGAEPVEISALKEVALPNPTKSHVPVPHYRFLDMVKYALGAHGHEIESEEYGVTPDGMRFFGVLRLQSRYHDYTDVVGLRNSNDKAFPASVSYGSQVFVCDNLAFVGEHVVKRKHTAKLLRDLPGLVMEMIEPLAQAREHQFNSIQRFKGTEIDQLMADFILMESYRQGVINVQRIADVYNEWITPSFDVFLPRNAWSMFNAFTNVLAGKVAGNPKPTGTLNSIIEGVCTPLD